MPLSHRGSLGLQTQGSQPVENVYEDNAYSIKASQGMQHPQNRVPGVDISRISSSGRGEDSLTVGDASSSIKVERVNTDQMMKIFTERERQDTINALPNMNKSSLQISMTGRDRSGNKYTTVT